MSDRAHDELMAYEVAVFAMADLLHMIAAGLPADCSVADLAEDTLDVYDETTREIVLAALAAAHPSNLAEPPQHPRRGHLRLVGST